MIAAAKSLHRASAYLLSLWRRALVSPGLGRTGAVIAVALVGWLLVMGLFYVWTRMQLVQISYEVADLEKKNKALQERKQELLLEIASLQSPGELEAQARKKAGLIFPAMGRVVHVP